jgi:hypothetical protein
MEPLLPKATRVYAKLLGDDIIPMKPGENYTEALRRFILERRMKKLIKIKKKIKGS